MQQKADILSGPASGIYLLTGEDDFRKKLALDRLKKKFLGDRADAFNHDVYYGKESSAEEIIRSLETFPLTGGNKLVVVKEPELLAEEDIRRLRDYLKSPRTGRAVLILLTERPSSRSEKFNTIVSKHTKTFDFAKLEPGDIASWVVKEFKSRSKAISRGGAELICVAAGRDSGRIFSLIEQLSIFTGKRENVTGEDIAQFAEGGPGESSTFRLLDSINERDTGSSIRILKELLRSESNPSQIIGLLSWHITRLIEVKRLMATRAPKSEMLSYFRTGAYILNRLISQAGNFTLNQLKRKLDLLIDTDLMLKRSSIKGDCLLEILVVKLAK